MTRSTSKRQPGARMLSRRRLLQAGGIGALSMGLPGMVGAQVAGDRGLGKGAAEKSVIFVLLCGGPSHIDTWDLKPEAPAEAKLEATAEAKSKRKKDFPDLTDADVQAMQNLVREIFEIDVPSIDPPTP